MNDEPLIHDPKNLNPIERVWVWLSQDEDGNEGILATNIGPCPGPMVTGKWEHVPVFDGLAFGFGRYTNKKIIRAEFIRIKDIQIKE